MPDTAYDLRVLEKVAACDVPLRALTSTLHHDGRRLRGSATDSPSLGRGPTFACHGQQHRYITRSKPHVAHGGLPNSRDACNLGLKTIMPWMVHM